MDQRAIEQIVRTSAAYRGWYAPMVADFSLSPVQIVRDDIYVACEADRVVGLYGLQIEGDEAELDLLFVANDQQGKGIGAALFEHACARALVLGCHMLTIVSHPPARGFYERMGARWVGWKLPSGRARWVRPVLKLDLGSLRERASAVASPAPPRRATYRNRETGPCAQ